MKSRTGSRSFSPVDDLLQCAWPHRGKRTRQKTRDLSQLNKHMMGDGQPINKSAKEMKGLRKNE
jgi:hypothetical protein